MRASETQSDSCPVCKEPIFHKWKRSVFEICNGCGYVRLSAKTDAENCLCNQEKYFSADFTSQKDIFTRFYEQLNARRRLSEIEGFLQGGRVLEVGVGRGNLLLALRAKGYRVDGIDISPALCAELREHCGLQIYCGSLEKYVETVSSSTYDAIIMSHVLEHVKSPGATLNTVRYLLKPMGIFYVAVPNLSSWDAYLPGWSGFEPYHMHYFNPVNLRRLVESAGFNILYERTFEPISGWFNAIIRSARYHTLGLKNDENTHRTGLIWNIYNIIRFFSGLLLSPIRWLQSGLGYGEELVMIAHRDHFQAS